MEHIDRATTPFEPGAPVPEGFIPLCVPEIRGSEWKYIKECLDANFVSSVGPFVDRFEQAIADYIGCKYGVATVNGTSALHISLLVAGVQPNDEVLVSTLTFIAPANAIRYAGAWPVFIDAEPEYWQIDPQRALDFLENQCESKGTALYNKATKRRVSAILPVHILGHPVDMDPILEIARRYNLAVIEDASEALGAKYKGRMVGQLGDIACLSFNGNKLITTGGGGMIVTDNEAWASRAKYLTTQTKDDPVEYIHNEIGYNYRLTNIQAALGLAQFEKINEYIDAKRNIAASYSRAFSEAVGITWLSEAPQAVSTFWLYTMLVAEQNYGSSSRQLLNKLNEVGVQARPLWQPLHSSHAHAKGSIINQCPVAERLYRDAISVPSSVGLAPADQQKVIKSILGFNNE